ncbi:hypothetical protein NC651_030439 [Populus alba x Populus x berolinensis]|nr:hypothetical protein NC651_030439 [Populus alba x Populus x berolinensis]
MRMLGDLNVLEIGLNAAAESKPRDCMLQTTCGTPPLVAPEAIPRKGCVWASGPKLTSCLTGRSCLFCWHFIYHVTYKMVILYLR